MSFINRGYGKYLNSVFHLQLLFVFFFLIYHVIIIIRRDNAFISYLKNVDQLNEASHFYVILFSYN